MVLISRDFLNTSLEKIFILSKSEILTKDKIIMSKTLNISEEEILHEIRVSCQIPGLKQAIAIRKIIANAAQEANVKVEIAELQQTADNLRLTYNLLKAEDTWAWLEEHHLSLDDFEGIAYTNLLANKLATHLFGAKVEQFFYENQLNYAAAVTYEVILDDEDLAWELFYALKEKEISFPEVAHQYIENIELRRVVPMKKFSPPCMKMW
jgi:hypothetical protein